MANKRMFDRSIVMSDAFLEMPASARALYFVLSMMADDDGVVGSPKAAVRVAGVSPDDYVVLRAKGFVLELPHGVALIKHWRINNTLKGDRYRASTYQDELQAVRLKDDKSYSMKPGPKTLDDAVENFVESFEVQTACK